MKGPSKARSCWRPLPLGLDARQLTNKANARAHYETNGPEIWVGIPTARVEFWWRGWARRYGFRRGAVPDGANLNVRSLLLEPAESPVLSGGKFLVPTKSRHRRAGFVPGAGERWVDEGAGDRARRLCRRQALPRQRGCWWASLLRARRRAAALVPLQTAGVQAGKNIVAVLPDTGERYLSTDLFKRE